MVAQIYIGCRVILFQSGLLWLWYGGGQKHRIRLFYTYLK